MLLSELVQVLTVMNIAGYNNLSVEVCGKDGIPMPLVGIGSDGTAVRLGPNRFVFGMFTEDQFPPGGTLKYHDTDVDVQFSPAHLTPLPLPPLSADS